MIVGLWVLGSISFFASFWFLGLAWVSRDYLDQMGYLFVWLFCVIGTFYCITFAVLLQQNPP